jgi:hypothetical protein
MGVGVLVYERCWKDVRHCGKDRGFYVDVCPASSREAQR